MSVTINGNSIVVSGNASVSRSNRKGTITTDGTVKIMIDGVLIHDGSTTGRLIIEYDQNNIQKINSNSNRNYWLFGLSVMIGLVIIYEIKYL